jgi:secernin
MGGDAIAALERATLNGHTLFGHNCRRPAVELLELCHITGRSHAPEERIETGRVALPQARETYALLGVQTRGHWGLHHGVNLWGVAAGWTRLRTRLKREAPGLGGSDLVRLALERGRTARQANDLVGDLVSRHGTDGDCALLIADGREAFVLETAGRHWVYQEVREARAITDLCTVGQDWDGIAPGLSTVSIDNGWWPADGSKLDFAGVVALPAASSRAELRRWGRATLLLEEQNGQIDLGFIRRLLGDHYEGCADECDPLLPGEGLPPLCQHAETPDAPLTASSLVVSLDPKVTSARLAWCCAGPPCTGVYLPLLLNGDAVEAYGTAATGPHARVRELLRHIGRQRGLWELTRDSLGRLQARLDQETEDYVIEAAAAGERETPAELGRRATLFMRHARERFEETVEGLRRQRPRRSTTTEIVASGQWLVARTGGSSH